MECASGDEEHVIRLDHAVLGVDRAALDDRRSQESVAQIAYRADGTIYSENVLINRDLNETLNLNCERAYLKANRKAAITALQKFCLRQRQNGTWDITVLKKAEQYFGQEKEGMKRPYLGAILFFINRYSQKNS